MSARKLAMITFRVLQLVFLALVVVGVLFDPGFPWWSVFLPLVLAYALITVVNRWNGGAPDAPGRSPEPVEVAPPVTGRWSALNSPADRTPSHGVHAYGQTFAIDLVAEPEPGARPGFRALWPLARRPRDFPAFGAPMLAVADGTVVRADDGQRDHLSRTSLPALLYLMLVEGSVRELAGSAASSATTWCWKQPTVRTPCTPTSSEVPSPSARATASAPARSSPGAATPATPRSRTSTSS